MIVYISIGNSDDTLTQSRWADYVQDVRDAISDEADKFHGQWFSDSASAFQNACWCAEIHPLLTNDLKETLRGIAAEYDQDSIAWAVGYTEFLEGVK